MKTVFGYTEEVEESRRVRQGEVLSPLKFVLFMGMLEEYLLSLGQRWATDKEYGLRPGGMIYPSLLKELETANPAQRAWFQTMPGGLVLFADDVWLAVRGSKVDFQRLVDAVSAFFALFGMISNQASV